MLSFLLISRDGRASFATTFGHSHFALSLHMLNQEGENPRPGNIPRNGIPDARQFAADLLRAGFGGRSSQVTAHVQRLADTAQVSPSALNFYGELLRADRGSTSTWVRSATRVTADLMCAEPKDSEWRSLKNILVKYASTREMIDRGEAEAAAQTLRRVAELDRRTFASIVSQLGAADRLALPLSQTVALAGLVAALRPRLSHQQSATLISQLFDPTHEDGDARAERMMRNTLTAAGLPSAYTDAFVSASMEWFTRDGFERRRCDQLTLLRFTAELVDRTAKDSDRADVTASHAALGRLSGQFAAETKRLVPILGAEITDRLAGAERVAPFLEHLNVNLARSPEAYFEFAATLGPSDPHIEKYPPDLIAQHREQEVRNVAQALAHGATSGRLPTALGLFDTAVRRRVDELVERGEVRSAADLVTPLKQVRSLFSDLSVFADRWKLDLPLVGAQLVACLGDPHDGRYRVLRRAFELIAEVEKPGEAIGTLLSQLLEAGPLTEAMTRRAYGLLSIAKEHQFNPEIVGAELLRASTLFSDTAFARMIKNAQEAEREGLPDLAQIKRDTLRCAAGLPTAWKSDGLVEPGLRCVEGLVTAVMSGENDPSTRNNARELLARFFSFGPDFALLRQAALEAEQSPADVVRSLGRLASAAAVRRLALGADGDVDAGQLPLARHTLATIYNAGGCSYANRTRRPGYDVFLDQVNRFDALNSLVDLGRGMAALSVDLTPLPASGYSIFHRVGRQTARSTDVVPLVDQSVPAVSIRNFDLERLRLTDPATPGQISDAYQGAVGYRALRDLQDGQIIGHPDFFIATGPNDQYFSLEGEQLSLLVVRADVSPSPALLLPTRYLSTSLSAGRSPDPLKSIQRAIEEGAPIVSLLEPGVVGGFVYGMPIEVSPLQRFVDARHEQDLSGRPHLLAAAGGELALLTTDEELALAPVRLFEQRLHGIVDRYVSMAHAFRMVVLGGWHRGDTDGDDHRLEFRANGIAARLSRARMFALSQEWMEADSSRIPNGRPILTISSTTAYRRGFKPTARFDLDEGRLHLPGRTIAIPGGDCTHPRALEKWMRHVVPLFANNREDLTAEPFVTTDVRFQWRRDLIAG